MIVRKCNCQRMRGFILNVHRFFILQSSFQSWTLSLLISYCKDNKKRQYGASFSRFIFALSGRNPKIHGIDIHKKGKTNIDLKNSETNMCVCPVLSIYGIVGLSEIKVTILNVISICRLWMSSFICLYLP